MNNLTKQATMEHTFEYNDENIVINIKEEEYQHYKELAVRIIVEREKDLRTPNHDCVEDKMTSFYFYEIETIDGILVDVYMKICKNYKNKYLVKFDIRDNRNMDKSFMGKYLQDNIEIINIDIITGCLIKMKHILSNIKFCIIKSQFEFVREIEHIMKRRTLITSIFQSDNVKMNGDMCSVCHELTQEKLICSHHLCVKCFQQMREKLIKETDDEEEPDDLKCPICRGEFSMYSYY